MSRANRTLAMSDLVRAALATRRLAPEDIKLALMLPDGLHNDRPNDREPYLVERAGARTVVQVWVDTYRDGIVHRTQRGVAHYVVVGQVARGVMKAEGFAEVLPCVVPEYQVPKGSFVPKRDWLRVGSSWVCPGDKVFTPIGYEWRWET